MTIDEMIAVLTAAKEGKTIQNRLRGTDEKFTDVTPSWNFYQHDYRVKPEPREFWIHVPKHHTLPMWVSACPLSDDSSISESFHVREVIDDK